MRRIVFPLLALVLVFHPLVAQEAPDAKGRAFTPEDWYKLTRLSTPAMSPDGSQVAFTVTTVDESENALHSEVWMVSTQGGEPVRLTSPGTESSRPRWSEDGTQLFFTSRREGGEGGTWVLQMDGTRMGEAFQIETGPQGSEPANGAFTVWTESPEEEAAVEEEDEEEPDPYARMVPMARPPLGSVTKPVNPSRFDGRHIVDFPYKRNGAGFTPNRREPREWIASQIFRQASGDTAKIQLTDDEYSHSSAVVSPDGRWIVFVTDPQMRPDSVIQAEREAMAELPYDADRDEAPRNDADIFIIPSDGGEPRRLTTMNGSERGPICPRILGRSPSFPAWPEPSRDGSGWWMPRVESPGISWGTGNTSLRAWTGCPMGRWP